MGHKYFGLWNKEQEHRLPHCPVPISLALQLIKARYNLSSFEKAIYLILKRDPEVKEILRYITTGKVPLEFKEKKDEEA